MQSTQEVKNFIDWRKTDKKCISLGGLKMKDLKWDYK